MIKHLNKLVKTDPDTLVDRRIRKFCDMGVVEKASVARTSKE
ncbi:MAG: hypothetical protein ACK6A5_03975 [Flavobacteriales bacterium]